MRSRSTAIVMAALLIASLTGCTFGAIQSTRQAYDPSDGIGVNIGDVHVRNALLISDDVSAATLSVSIVNSGVQNVALQVSYETATGRTSENVYITAGSTLSLGTATNPLVLSGIDAKAGALFPVFFQYGDVEGSEVRVPVLDGALPQYADLVPRA
ncbi:MAG: hypothetical protein H7146_12120 [Burkholderiaceae bacterium]|nr:hypothetical protein [Microbacteriaceae bacterium]